MPTHPPTAASALEVQAQIVSFIQKDWWFFILGSPVSHPAIVAALIKRYYPQDDHQRPWQREWVLVDKSLLNPHLHIVALDKKYMTFAQIDAEFQKGEHDMYIRQADAADGDVLRESFERTEGPGVNIFTPTHGPDPEQCVAEGERMAQVFLGFLRQEFPAACQRYVPEMDARPVVFPQVVATDTLAPELVQLTPWHPVADPAVKFVRFSAWLLVGGKGADLTGLVLCEFRDHQELLHSDKVYLSPPCLHGPESRTAMREVLTDVLADCTAKVARHDFHVSLPGAPDAPQA